MLKLLEGQKIVNALQGEEEPSVPIWVCTCRALDVRRVLSYV